MSIDVGDHKFALGAATVVAIVGVMWLFFSGDSQVDPGPRPSVPESNDPGLRIATLWPDEELPFEGTPQAGRPRTTIPIADNIYSGVELYIDGELVTQTPVSLTRGSTVSVHGVIRGHDVLPQGTHIGCGMALASSSDNDAGWVIHNDSYLDGKTRGEHAALYFQGTYAVPEITGEHNLLVLSWANEPGAPKIPILVAAVYEATVN